MVHQNKRRGVSKGPVRSCQKLGYVALRFHKLCGMAQTKTNQKSNRWRTPRCEQGRAPGGGPVRGPDGVPEPSPLLLTSQRASGCRFGSLVPGLQPMVHLFWIKTKDLCLSKARVLSWCERFQFEALSAPYGRDVLTDAAVSQPFLPRVISAPCLECSVTHGGEGPFLRYTGKWPFWKSIDCNLHNVATVWTSQHPRMRGTTPYNPILPSLRFLFPFTLLFLHVLLCGFFFFP